MTTRPLQLRKLREASHNLERAAFWTVEADHAVARDFAAEAVLYAVEAMGHSEATIASVRALIEAEPAPGTDWPRERVTERIYDHARDARVLEGR